MPIAKRYSMDELLKACKDYFDITGRRVTFEYSMISGVNDFDRDAYELADRLADMNCHVNLIPVNTVDGTRIQKEQYGKATGLCKYTWSKTYCGDSQENPWK